jgi:uncharacterized protein with GYD domain
MSVGWNKAIRRHVINYPVLASISNPVYNFSSRRTIMPHFLIEASYTAEGLRGLAKDKASGREEAIKTSLAAIGGKLIGIYYALGEADVFAIFECPDQVSAAAMSVAASSSGLIRTKTIPLMTVTEADKALSMKTGYRAPGASKAAKA